MQAADVDETLRSAFRINQRGVKIALDGPRSYFQVTKTDQTTKNNVESGQRTFNLWVKAGQRGKVPTEAGARRNDTDGWKKGNRFATLQ